MEAPMRTRVFLLVTTAGLAVALFRAAPGALSAQTRSSVVGGVAPSFALTGQITSMEEGRMEGVLVSARKAGSTVTITVASDEQGRYRFPSAKLEPGRYSMRIRAVGYDLDSPDAVEVTQGKTATADLKLRKAHDLAAQLSNSEWLASLPGTDQQKGSVRNCTHCHRLELVTRSRHDAAGFLPVLERMSGYPPLSFPLMPQKLRAARLGGGEDPLEHRQEVWKRQAQYLSTINLNSAPQWGYAFKTLPRPTGKATRVIYTEYDLPKPTRQPHDVIVDSEGTAWFASFGEQILGKLDPRTGKVTEYPIPVLKPLSPTGILGLRFDADENLWLGMQFQAGVAKFDRKTATFKTWSLSPELNGEHVQINQVGPQYSQVNGKVWAQDAGTYTLLRLDLASGKWEAFAPFPIPRPNIYDVIPDARNNAYFTVFGGEQIGRIDAKTGHITLYATPTRGSGPRRGMMDSQGRLWFGENHANRIGMFDTRTERFQEWVAPTAESWPYDVTVDKNGEAWSGGEYSDRVLRLDPKTGQFTEYLLPRFTNIRRVFVDNSTTPVTFWVGNNHGASIIKLEPLDQSAGTESR
jgi:virginiamycin B lyase